MAVYALGDLEPEIDPAAYVHPEAVVIGAVVIGAESSVWPHAVVRGDDSTITIGARTSIQDGAVIHCTELVRSGWFMSYEDTYVDTGYLCLWILGLAVVGLIMERRVRRRIEVT